MKHHTCAGRLLLFGASGSIGTAISECFVLHEWDVIAASRRNRLPDGTAAAQWDPLDERETECPSSITGQAPFDAVCWAQGMNGNDSIRDFARLKHEEMYRANVLFIISSLQRLLQAQVLAPRARLCIVSSVWQHIARQNKLSYSVTKAALRGLVLSTSIDLAGEGYLINAILPGALDTPMTNANLGADQIARLAAATPFGRLATLSDVAETALFLCSPNNTSITGQFITIDLGYSHARIV